MQVVLNVDPNQFTNDIKEMFASFNEEDHKAVAKQIISEHLYFSDKARECNRSPAYLISW